MRVTPPPRLNRDEDGAAAVIFAIALLAIFGVAALALDVGQMWLNRRSVTSDADSAALAVASDISRLETITGVGSCTTTWQDVTVPAAAWIGGVNAGVAANVHAQARCPYDGAVTVTVDYFQDVQHTFGQVVSDEGSTRVPARTTVEIGVIESMTGLRPIGLCVGEPHYQEWIALPRMTPPVDDEYHFAAPGGGTAHRIDFVRSDGADDCSGGNAGNWGWLDFDGNGPIKCGKTTKELTEWLQNGYPCSVTADLNGIDVLPNTAQCAPETVTSDCGGQPGANADAAVAKDAALASLLCVEAEAACESDGKVFWILIYDYADGNGAGAAFHPVNFQAVILRDFNKPTGVLPKPDAKEKKELDTSGWGGGICPPHEDLPDVGYFCFQFLDREVKDGTIAGSLNGSVVGLPVTRTRICQVETTSTCIFPTPPIYVPPAAPAG